jgi:uncharacterized protein (DUF849 family)
VDKLLISVAPTGCVAQKSDNPALPITPEEVAEAVNHRPAKPPVKS